MPATILSPNAKQQFFDDDGSPLAGGKVYTYAANTTTNKATYTNRAGTVANTNPIILDARGECVIYLTPGQVYDYKIERADASQVWTREDVTAEAGDANAVGYTQAGASAKLRTSQDKMRERVTVTDFEGVDPTGVLDSTAAFVAARDLLDDLTEFRGGTIKIPRGRYKLDASLVFSGIADVTNYWLEGDGILNTVLDFSGAPASTDGIVFNGGSQVGVSGLMIDGAPGRGLVLNDSFASFVSMATIRELRIQNCGAAGVYSKNSYLVTMQDILSAGNGGAGFSFVGNHTSIIADKIYAKNNLDTGVAINGAVYIQVNAQSDGNLRGYALSNIRGGVLSALGTEVNQAEGILLTSSDASATNIFPEYQNIDGLVIQGAYQINNNATGPVGTNASIAAITENSRPITFTLIGCVDVMPSGETSLALAGTSGKITVTEIDCVYSRAQVVSGNVERRNLSNTGRYALIERSSGAVSIPNNTPTTMTWNGFATGENTLGATFASNAIVIPAGVNSVEVSACVTWAGVSGGQRYIGIQKNGVGFKGMAQSRVPSSGALACAMTVCSSKPIPVVAGDTFTLTVLHDQGAALNIEGLTGNGNWLCVKAVS